MLWLERLCNLLRRRRLDRDLAEEMASHLDEAVARGRSPVEARRAFGNELLYREQSRDGKLLPWLDSLLSDALFGCRQLRKRPAATAAAVLSLALATGAATAAFRLINAVLLRQLPVAHPERLWSAACTYVNSFGRPDYLDDFDYPSYPLFRQAVAGRADLLVTGHVMSRESASFSPGAQPERFYRQYVSGNFFEILGLRASVGRVLTADDDRAPGAAPVAVLSYDFWTRRFNRSPAVIGSTFRFGDYTFAIVGVGPQGFIGTEPGSVTDLFMPATMNVAAVKEPGWTWFRMLVYLKDGVSPEQVRQPLHAVLARIHQEEVKSFSAGTPRAVVDAYLDQKLVLLPAGSGASDIQKEYRRPLLILGILVALVLLIACMNVSNLMTAQAAARAREMALRVSIGAGRWRLIQLVLVESAIVAALASALGALFASWSAPLVVAMLHVPQDPVRLVLDNGWRDLLFAVSLAASVALLFGLAPALRASNVTPMSSLRGGGNPHANRRLMTGLLALQMAFCILVQFVAGLFVSTLHTLATRPLGFAPERLLVMDGGTPKDQPAQFWMQGADRLRATPGVRSVAFAGWALLQRDVWRLSIRVPGSDPATAQPWALEVSPGYFATMEVRLLDGREFRVDDPRPRFGPSKLPLPGVAIVNQAFAKTYFNGQNPVGRTVEIALNSQVFAPAQIVGYVADTVYRDMREPMHAVIYLPQGEKWHNTFLVRTAGDPLPMIPVMRRALAAAGLNYGVHLVQPESLLLRWQTLRERLLASLSLFFAVVAMLLAAIGLYGVLNYSIAWQRREIGIRMALGARPLQIVRRTARSFAMATSIGVAAGLGAGAACGRFLESLLFGIKAGDLRALAVPILLLIVVALAAALPPALRAVRIDPAETLRAE